MIEASDCTVKGLVRNRCSTNGIFLQNADHCFIEGNFIGTDASGTASLPNGEAGIYIYPGSNNLIGGLIPAARNLISGNTTAGVLVSAQNGKPANGNVVQGNYIGSDAAGRAPLGKGDYGISMVFGPADTVIGGPTSGAGNLSLGIWRVAFIHICLQAAKCGGI